MKRQLLRATALPLALALLCPIVARSATYSNGSQSGPLVVSLVIQGGCSITATPLLFGTRSVLTAAITATTTVVATCTPTTPYNIGLDAGNVTGSTVATRLMANTAQGSTATVNFNLYKEAAFQNVWGNTQDTTTVAGTVGTGLPQTYTVYGQIPPQPTPAIGTYQATITATVYY